jgi:tRNA 2-thiouridine synthesizing protein A
VDATGLRCPLPLLKLMKACEADPAACRVVIHVTDPGFRDDLDVFCARHGFVLVRVTTGDGETSTFELLRRSSGNDPHR